MPKLFLWTFLILTLFVSGCAASAQTNAPVRNYVYLTNDIHDYYKRPSGDQIYELAVGFPKHQCAEMKAKAIENHNAFYKAMKILSYSNEGHYSYDIIGEHSFIKYYGCHPDLKTPGQNVVVIGLDTKERIEEEKKTGRRTLALNSTYTFFDKKGNIVRWGR
ncbi:MAG: hypothetical protein L3J65_00050 [Robiginitomaculum sp.]|nr:hypothetical protein [Robiginitomaculum sp.]